jgi:hypothetical protein
VLMPATGAYDGRAAAGGEVRSEFLEINSYLGDRRGFWRACCECAHVYLAVRPCGLGLRARPLVRQCSADWPEPAIDIVASPSVITAAVYEPSSRLLKFAFWGPFTRLAPVRVIERAASGTGRSCQPPRLMSAHRARAEWRPGLRLTRSRHRSRD